MVKIILLIYLLTAITTFGIFRLLSYLTEETWTRRMRFEVIFISIVPFYNVAGIVYSIVEISKTAIFSKWLDKEVKL